MQLIALRPRTLLVALTFLAIVWPASSAVLASEYTDAIDLSAPIAWYRLDPDANDSAGTNHGYPSATDVAFGLPGALLTDTNGSAQFTFIPPEHMGGVVTVPDAAVLNFGTADDFSVEFWAKCETSPFAQVVLNKGNTYNAYWARINANGEAQFVLDYGSSANSITTSTADSKVYNDNQWHHFVGVADRNEKLMLYVDGQFAGETPILGRGTVSTPGYDAQIGYLPVGPRNPANYWGGSMDEVAVYDTALSDIQVADHYLAGAANGSYDVAVSADSPIGWWRMADETDSGSGAHTCAAGAGATFGQTTTIVGDTTGAMVMDGTTDEPPINITDSADLNFGTDSDYTIEAWIKVDFMPASPYGTAMIFNKGDTTTGYWLRVQGVDGTVRFLMDYGTSILDAQGGYVLDGGWHHVVGVADRDYGLSLYVDSILVDFQGLFDGNDVSSELDMTIGMLNTSNPMNGFVDEVTIYDYALTETDALAHYEAAGYSIVDIPGDANGSGTVDDDDAAILAENWGASGTEIGWGQGDFNGDNTVNAIDAAILAANWGATVASEATSTVPEPTALAGLFTIALAAVGAGRRRRAFCHA